MEVWDAMSSHVRSAMEVWDAMTSYVSYGRLATTKKVRNAVHRLAARCSIVVVKASKCEAFMCVKKHPFLGLHIAYFVVLSLVGTLSLWAASKPQDPDPLSFVDALFNAVSALTETGLASVPMHRFSVANQITLLLLMVVGAQVFTSSIPLFIRIHLFSRPNPRKQTDSEYPSPPHLAENVDDGTDLQVPPNEAAETYLPSYTTADHMQKLAMEDTALFVMCWVTVFHYVFSVVIGFLLCQICIVWSPHASAVLKENHVNSSFFALFAAVSAFGNCGFLPLDENMVPLQRSWVLLLCLSTLMLLGNTLYAPAMRLWIWLLYKRAKGDRKKVYKHMLHSRQRCYTHFFPIKETFWLVGTVVFFNTFQVMCMLGIDWRSKALMELEPGYKLVAALFQSIAFRTGGMNVVSLSGFSSATLFVTLAAMYISTYPIYFFKETTRESPLSIFATQLYKLRSRSSVLFLAIFFILWIERESLENDPLNFSFFNIIYEVISAYGNVGLTIGYDCTLKTLISRNGECMNLPIASSGRWSVGGQVALVMVMFYGRHRNLFDDCDWDITPLCY